MSGSYNLNIFSSKKEEKEKKKKKNEKNMEEKQEKVENADPQPSTSAQVDETQKKKKKKKNKFKIQHDEVSSTTVDPSSELLSHMKSHQMRKYLLVKAGGEALNSQVFHYRLSQFVRIWYFSPLANPFFKCAQTASFELFVRFISCQLTVRAKYFFYILIS